MCLVMKSTTERRFAGCAHAPRDGRNDCSRAIAACHAAAAGFPISRGNMKMTANARFAIKSWDEKPYSEGQDLPKLTRASITKTYTGSITGEAHVEYLMMYRSDGSA